jgi:hypothetical protein
MDHAEALRLNAAEKYMLGELGQLTREQYEEHFSDCGECAGDLRALSTFISASRELLREEATQRQTKGGVIIERPIWLNWLRPAFAIPAMGVLLAGLIYQQFVTIPQIRKETGTPVSQAYESAFRIQGATRGDEVSRVAVSPDETFAINFDFVPQSTFPSFSGAVFDGSGKQVLTFHLQGSLANKEVSVVVPGQGLKPGRYEIVIAGANTTHAVDRAINEVQRLSFDLEVRK